MKIIKKAMSLFLAFLFVFGMAGGLSGCVRRDDGSSVTRGQWIEILASEFGMNDYNEDTPYFTDVSAAHELFPYIQSCLEWGLFDEAGKAFRPDYRATRQFIAETAVLATGVIPPDVSDMHQAALQYAVEKGMLTSLDKKYLSQYAGIAECVTIIDWALDTYINKEFVAYNHVQMNEAVIDITDMDAAKITVDEFTVSIAEETASYKPGDIIITPATIDEPQGIAKKITAVRTENGVTIYDTEEPALEDIYDELAFAQVIVPDMSNVIPAPGVEIDFGPQVSGLSFGKEGLLSVMPLTGAQNDAALVPVADGLSFNAKINFTKGSVSITPKWNDLALGVEFLKQRTDGSKDPSLDQWFDKSTQIPDKTLMGKDAFDNSADIDAYRNGDITAEELKSRLPLNKDGWEKSPTLTNKFKGGYELTGTLSISELRIQPDLKLKKFLGVPYAVESFSTEVNYKAEISTTLKGSVTDELTVAYIPIPIGPSGITITLELSLYVELNGEISLKASVTNNTKTEWHEGKTKKVSTQDSSVSGEASVTLQFGPQLSAVFSAFGIKVIDAKLKCGMLFEASVSIKGTSDLTEGDTMDVLERKIVLERGVNGYIPIITFSVGTHKGTLANKLGIKFTWDIMKKDKALKIPLWETKEFELWKDVLEFPHTDLSTPSPDPTPTADPNAVPTENPFRDRVGIDKFYVNIAEGENEVVSVIGMPDGYEFYDLEWVSGDPAIATVDSFGNVTAIAPGSTSVTITSKNGKLAEQECAVTVTSSETVDLTPLSER